jgi:hypothetical protein
MHGCIQFHKVHSQGSKDVEGCLWVIGMACRQQQRLCWCGWIDGVGSRGCGFEMCVDYSTPRNTAMLPFGRSGLKGVSCCDTQLVPYFISSSGDTHHKVLFKCYCATATATSYCFDVDRRTASNSFVCGVAVVIVDSSCRSPYIVQSVELVTCELLHAGAWHARGGPVLLQCNL